MDKGWQYSEKEVVMDKETEQVWISFVRAEKDYREKMGELRQVDMLTMLREGLSVVPWRRPALAVLVSSNVEISQGLLPELFSLSCRSHSLLGEVRRCIMRIPREVLEVELEPLILRIVTDQGSDYEAYRRTAELLDDLDIPSLLGVITRAAATSADNDIREVADDFYLGHEA